MTSEAKDVNAGGKIPPEAIERYAWWDHDESWIAVEFVSHHRCANAVLLLHHSFIDRNKLDEESWDPMMITSMIDHTVRWYPATVADGKLFVLPA